MKKPNMALKIAVLAQCHQCMGYWQDGHSDCHTTTCSLYHWQPYRKQESDLEWLEYNPKRKGRVKWEDCGIELTDEQRAQMAERLRKVRK